MSAPSGPVQVIPPGFLGLLNLKNQGRIPDVLQGNFQPTLDMLEWLLFANREILRSEASIGATASSSFFHMTSNGPLRIPEHEVWYVWDINVELSIPAGGASSLSGYMAPAVLTPDGTSIQTFGLPITGLFSPALTSMQPQCGHAPRRLFSSGNEFGVSLGEYGGVATHMVTTLEISRLQV